MAEEPLSAALAPFGLQVLGTVPEAQGSLALIGPEEPRFWSVFSASAEYQDDQPDPLDRWSARVLGAVASTLGGAALFPFGGPPHQPFYSWALASGRCWRSPIGFLVHETAGLFVSFRGAIRLAEPPSQALAMPPCTGCAAPCLTACPVNAFTEDGYDVAACKAHVSAPEGADCREGGCLARRACPVGKGLRLPEQAAFHMQAFL